MIVERVGGPPVVGAAELALELGVVAAEARLERERREDHFGADTVALLVSQTILGVEVADGREANRQFWTAFFTALPDLTATMEDLVISGDRVVGRFTYRGTHTSAFMGIPASGNPVDYAGGDPIANLELVRSIFFPNPGYTLGGRKKQVNSQAENFDPLQHPTDGKYVENVIWEQSKVVFVTINLPGGSNNDNDIWYGTPAMSSAQSSEILERTDADLRWLDQAFAVAQQDDDIKGVVIVAQADMWDPEKGAAHQTGYEPIVQTVASDTKAFGRPVLMFNGDSHVYRSDNPLRAKATCAWELTTPCVSVYSMHPGYNVPNFHRIVVHGSTTPLEWLKLTVDPSADSPNRATAFGPFSWERETQT
jgi:hypothetical protein